MKDNTERTKIVEGLVDRFQPLMSAYSEKECTGEVADYILDLLKEERKKTLEEVGAYAEVECEFIEQKDKTYKGWLWLESLQEVLSKLKSKLLKEGNEKEV